MKINIKETGYFIVSRRAMRKAKIVVIVAFDGFLQEADSGGQTIPNLTLLLPSATLFMMIRALSWALLSLFCFESFI